MLHVHCFLISLWEYFTAFAYLLFPYGSHEASERHREKERERRRAGFRGQTLPNIGVPAKQATVGGFSGLSYLT